MSRSMQNPLTPIIFPFFQEDTISVILMNDSFRDARVSCGALRILLRVQIPLSRSREDNLTTVASKR